MAPFPLHAADMKDYCIIPPYVKRDVKPNILILMDNGAIMGEAAYTDNYDKTKTYSGLYKSNVMYTYGSNTWEPDASGIYSGNLLNWVTTSKYDLLQSILVGGKSTSRQTNVNVLVSMSNSWEKTLSYGDTSGKPQPRVCKFIVSNANLEIKDDTAGSCGYLDSPPHPLIALNESDTRLAINESNNPQAEGGSSKNILARFMKFSSGLFSSFMNFIVPNAEAAPSLRLPSGNTPDGTECTPYSASITASGGTEAGYTWSITAGSLPAGLTIAATGTPSTTISGTPTVSSGTYNFRVQVCDSAGCGVKHMDSKDYSITINDAAVSITTTSPMPDGTVGSWYRSPVRAGGVCTSSTSWALTAGSLPPGLSLGACTSGADCRDISGTPSSSGTYNFTLQVTDSENNTTTKSFSLTINPAAGSFQIVTASPLSEATKDVPYLVDISTSGSSCGSCCSCPGTYIWSITSGSLPPGLSFNTGGPCISGDHVYITGTPTNTGTFSFTVQVRDCNGNTATNLLGIAPVPFSLKVSLKPPTIRTTGNLDVKICAGSYAANCNNADTTPPYDPPCSESYTDKCVLKSGIVDQFWPQARFGIEDFNKQAGDAIPNLANCIEGNPSPEPDPNFMTAIENAIPIDPMTTLVNGAYTAIDYYANNTASNCDPFRNSQSCQRNFMLMISSGVGADNPPTPSGGTPDVFSDATNCTASNDPPASYNLAKNACFGYSNDLRNSPTFGGDNLPGRQIVSTYIVNTMGVPKDNDPGTNTAGDILYQAANAGGGVYYEVTDPAALREALIQAFQDILKRAAAGTAASVLASGEGSGANLLQAVFYPRRKVGNAEIAWTGRLTNFWYYVDPFFSSSSIYEDNAGPAYFNRTEDNRVTFFFDSTLERTMAHRYPPSGTLPDIQFENLNSLWEAGIQLWQRDNITRNIKVSTDSGVRDFTTANAGALSSLFDLPTADNNGDGFSDGDLNHSGGLPDADDARILIQYVRGKDFPAYPWLRPRTVSIDLNNNGTIDAGETNVWKLGDILNSTPKISSWIPLNTYDQLYKDASYTAFLGDANTYKNRGMVFVGGNDGMLHAFKLGRLELNSELYRRDEKNPRTCSFRDCVNQDIIYCDVACLANPNGYLGGPGVSLGNEVWSFIPKNVLPYLKFNKEPDYCHVYTVDLSPYVFDASIGAPGSGDISGNARPGDGSTWRTIVIGGMRYGGACKNSCPDANCIQTPAPDLGYSSYFALDVTDQNSPTLLWEFSNENLGLTTTGPVVVREGDPAHNGKWFVVVGSGPTGPISTSDQQFLARSDQNLQLFILDAKTGSLTRTIDTGIPDAFAGSMINSTMDVDLNYQDDIVYIGYVKKGALASTWTQGGIGRLQTKQSTNTSDWAWSQVIDNIGIDNIGPVTSSVTRLLNKSKGQLWIFFGTGRYYFEQQATVDDENSQRSLFGIKEPCYSTSGLNANCTTAFSGSLTDVSNTPKADPSAIADGWRINLDASGNYTHCEVRNPDGTCAQSVQRFYRAERVITDPLTTTSGLVFYVSYKPYSDVCAYGGKSFIWAVKYNTGGAAAFLLKGVALLQVSTGSIEQVDLSKAFTESGGRRTSAIEGVPPTAQGLSILSQPPPVKRVLHIKER
jgi:hypothetical protein